MQLFVHDNVLLPETHMDQVAPEWYDRQLLHLGLEKMHLDMKRRFQFPPRLYKALKGVCGSCQVCQAVKPPNRCQPGNTDWTPVPEVPMESVAINKFAMPSDLHGKEVYEFVILRVDHYSGYLVAVAARDKGLTAELVALLMMSHWLTVFGTPKSLYSGNVSNWTGAWFRTMCRF